MPQPATNPFGDPSYQPGRPDEVVKAELVPANPNDQGERISILYLMVWTACTAVILSLYRQSMTLVNDTEDTTWLQAMTGLVGAPIQGACVASLLLVLWRRFKGGRPFPKQPGHWLLVIPGITSLVGWSLWLVVQQFIEEDYYTYILFQRLPLLVLFSVLAVYAITKLRAEPRWRVMFIVWLAVNFVVMFFSCCLGGLENGTGIIESIVNMAIMLGFLIPTLLDVRDRTPRDHLHYAGIAARIGNAGMMVIQLLTMLMGG